MRILKKSLALLLALTMIASLVVVNVVAADPEKVEISLGTATRLSSNSAQENIEIPVYVQNTASTVFCALNGSFSVTGTGVTFTGFELAKNEIPGVPEAYWPAVLEGATLTVNGSDILIDSLSNFAVMTEKTKIGTAKFTIAADATVGDYALNFTVATGGLTNYAMQDVAYAVTPGTITVSEEQWISSTEAVALGDIEYGASTVPTPPSTVKGLGQTSGGTPITAADNIDLAVTWGTIDTFVEPADGKTLAGTVTATETDLLKFKNADGTAATLTASATYDIVKSTAGVVAPVAIEIQKKSEGVDTAIGALKDVTEIAAVTSTTIAIEGGATETVTLNWAAAENKTDAGNADENLNLGSDSDTLVVLVPVTGDTTYYDLTGMKAVVTINMAPAEIAGGSIAVKGQRATAIPEVTAVIPADGVAAGTYEVVVNFYALKDDGTPDYDALAKDSITVADVVVTAGQATTITATATKNLKDMGFDEVGEEFAVEVLVNNAALLVEGVAYITDNVVASTGSAPAGIGTPSVPAKPQTPVEKPEDPGTEEPGTEEPGTEEPGTEEPGTEEPGTEEPATGFEDVTAEFDWAAESINKLADLGVINGKGDNKFAPNDDITRAEFTKMIVTLLGLEATGTETAFADCTADDWFTPYVIAATEAGIVTGVADDAFAPNDTITREQACAIVGRAFALTGEAEATFTDAAEISDYAVEFVVALAELGIINGYEDGSFAPANNITRAEAAKILAGTLDIIAPVEDAPVEEAPAEEVVEEVVAE